MEKELIDNTDLHFEHEQWRRELLFWEDELKFFENRLGELETKWTDKDMLLQLESYQNQFTRHKEVINSLKHDINVHETNLAKFSQEHIDVLDHKLAIKHFKFRSRIEIQRLIYTELKKEFFHFLSWYL
jgi:hypothetical protein